MANFNPSAKSANDFNGGAKWRPQIDGITANDMNNLVEAVLYAQENGGSGNTPTPTTSKLYRHDLKFYGDNWSSLVEIYITIINSDPTNYTQDERWEYDPEDEVEYPVSISFSEMPYLPKNAYIQCTGNHGDSAGGYQDVAVSAVRLIDMGGYYDMEVCGYHRWDDTIFLDDQYIRDGDITDIQDTVTEL